MVVAEAPQGLPPAAAPQGQALQREPGLEPVQPGVQVQLQVQQHMVEHASSWHHPPWQLPPFAPGLVPSC